MSRFEFIRKHHDRWEHMDMEECLYEFFDTQTSKNVTFPGYSIEDALGRLENHERDMEKGVLARSIDRKNAAFRKIGGKPSVNPFKKYLRINDDL